MSAESLDLDAIEARANAATLGPWKRYEQMEQDSQVVQAISPRYGEYGFIYVGCPEGDGQARADAAFVAHARADIPALIAEVRRLREEAVAARDDVHDALLVAEQAEEDAARWQYVRDHVRAVERDSYHNIDVTTHDGDSYYGATLKDAVDEALRDAAREAAR